MKRHHRLVYRPELCGKQSKRRYLTRQDARSVARQLGHSSIYRCDVCGDYHVTHYTEREQKAIRLLLNHKPR